MPKDSPSIANERSGESRTLPRSQTRLRTKLALSLASLLVALLLVELGFRAFGLKGVYHPPRVSQLILQVGGPTEKAPGRCVPFAKGVHTYSSDPRGYFGAAKSIEYLHNSEGWRDDEHPIEKPANTFRILGLGDSYLWGEGVRREDICLTKLGPLLSKAAPELTIETINTGYPGLDTITERNVYNSFGRRYDPDLVILFFVPNDVVTQWHSGPKVEFFKEYHTIYEAPDKLSEYSYVWSWARQRFLREFTARSYIRTCVNTFEDENEDWRACRTALSDIQTLCATSDVPFMVAMFPFFHELDGEYPFQPIHDAVASYCQQNEIHFLDMRGHYREYNGPKLWAHPTDQHPNDLAHDIAANALAEYLKQQPELFTPIRNDASAKGNSP